MDQKQHQKTSQILMSQMRILSKVMLVPKLFGSFPFVPNKGKIQLSYWLLSLSVPAAAASIITAVHQALYGPPGKSGWSKIISKVSRGADVCHSLYIMASIVTYTFETSNLNRFVLKLAEARTHLGAVGYSRKISVSYGTMWLDLGILGFVLFSNRWTDWYNITMSLNYFFIYAAGSTLIFMYYSFLNIIGKQLEFLNDKTQFIVQQKHFKEKTVQLAKFADVHHTLCSAAEALQESHGYPLVVLFLSFFVKILVTARSLISSTTMTGPQFKDIGPSMAAMLISAVMKLCMIVRCAAFTSEQTKRFNQLLLENVVIQPSQEEWNVKLDLHLGLRREVDFSAAGFFMIDYPVLHSMLAMITSFLVVMIQTDQPATS